MRSKTVAAQKVEIFIAGDYAKALDLCQAFCASIGLCVTVTPTCYVYKGGREDGVIVGLINYARFPVALSVLETKALQLANVLLVGLGQQSYTIQTGDLSTLYTNRPDHVEIK